MLGKFFNKTQKNEVCAPKSKSAAIEDANQDPPSTIAEERKDDSLIGLKIGAKEIAQRIINALKKENGVHIETLLTALGALAGYSCQAAIREEFIITKGLPENKVFVVVNTNDGSRYFFGDLINNSLLENQYSVWGLAAGAANSIGSKDLIDINNLIEHVSKTVGFENFGFPRLPEKHYPAGLPKNYVKYAWPELLPVVKGICPKPSEWPIMFGIAIQEVLYMVKGVIDPTIALSIVMESAVPMSKIDINLL